MRDTSYARELVPPAITRSEDGIHESRMERLLIKETATEEIRFSWWKDGNMAVRPLDLPQEELLSLLVAGFGTVLTDDFLADLRGRIDAHLTKRLLAQTKKTD